MKRKIILNKLFCAFSFVFLTFGVISSTEAIGIHATDESQSVSLKYTGKSALYIKEDFSNLEAVGLDETWSIAGQKGGYNTYPNFDSDGSLNIKGNASSGNNIVEIKALGDQNITSIELSFANLNNSNAVVRANSKEITGEGNYEEMVYTFDEECLSFTVEAAGKSVFIRSFKINYCPKKSPEKELVSLKIQGTPSKTEYNVGDTFDTTGLTVQATYSDASNDDVTDKITFDVIPETFNTHGSSIEVKVTAKNDQITSTQATFNVKVILVEEAQINDEFVNDEIKYVVTSIGETKTVRVGENTSYTGTSLTIPTTVSYLGDTYDVTAIEDQAFRLCTSLTSVNLPTSLLSIEHEAFYGCGLTDLTIPANVTYIGEASFGLNNNLTRVTIQATTPPTIGDFIFSSCEKLTRICVPIDKVDTYKSTWTQYESKIIQIPWNIGASAYNTNVTAFVDEGTLYIEGAGEMLNMAKAQDWPWYSQKDIITKIVIGDEITNVGNHLSRGYSNLTEVAFGNSITTIGEGAFHTCEKLSAIEFPNNLASIGNLSFYRCNSLEKIIISNKVTNIGEEAFADSENLATIICKGTTPASIVSDSFENCSETLKIVVPTVSLEAYKTCWAAFKEKIVGTEIEKPIKNSNIFVYNGSPITYTLPESEYYSVTNNVQTETGKYSVTVSLLDKDLHTWSDGTTDDLTFEFIINQKAEDVVIQDKAGNQITDPKVKIVSAENGIEPDTVFVVEVVDLEKTEEISQTKELLMNNGNIAENEKIFGIYDAKLLLDGAEVQPNGMITIKMLVPEEIRNSNFKLYHIHNGTEVLTIEHSELDEAGFITFTTDKLSQFAFVSEVETPFVPGNDEGSTEDSGLGTGAIVGIVLGCFFLLLLIMYILGYFFLYRKNKLDEKKIKVIYTFLPKDEKKL